MKHEMRGDFLNTPIVEDKKLVANSQQRVCPSCHKGFMLVTGVMKTSMPPYYEHKCKSCGHKEDYRETYPRIVYLEKE